MYRLIFSYVMVPMLGLNHFIIFIFQDTHKNTLVICACKRRHIKDEFICIFKFLSACQVQEKTRFCPSLIKIEFQFLLCRFPSSKSIYSAKILSLSLSFNRKSRNSKLQKHDFLGYYLRQRSDSFLFVVKIRIIDAHLFYECFFHQSGINVFI